MILSFHPCFEADTNRICAGREPDNKDLEAIQSANAVILPQGCSRALWEMAIKNCRHVFPDFNARFKYPGKIGQAFIFKKLNVPHPLTQAFNNTETFLEHYNNHQYRPPFLFPFIVKFDHGGQGDYVFLVSNEGDIEGIMQKVKQFEKSGHSGFLVQEYIPSSRRTLRVVVIHQKMISYWRVQKNKAIFSSSLSQGAEIDMDSDFELQQKAMVATQAFCEKTGINLAGFDFLFPEQFVSHKLFFLEINYFFGREGLGGSEGFYKILNEEIINWLASLNYSIHKQRKENLL